MFRLRGRDHLRQAARVVRLGVVADDEVNVLRRDHGGDAPQHLRHEGLLDRIHERDLLAQNEIGVVGSAALVE